MSNVVWVEDEGEDFSFELIHRRNRMEFVPFLEFRASEIRAEDRGSGLGRKLRLRLNAQLRRS
jgi:hypothetical protein